MSHPPDGNCIEVLNPQDMEAFLNRRLLAVVHWDAEWDGYRFVVSKQMEKLIHSAPDTSLGYIDIDDHPEHARKMDLRNVPACVYYHRGMLVTLIIGQHQSIAANLALLRSGGTLQALT